MIRRKGELKYIKGTERGTQSLISVSHFSLNVFCFCESRLCDIFFLRFFITKVVPVFSFEEVAIDVLTCLFPFFRRDSVSATLVNIEMGIEFRIFPNEK